jgi:regulator of protease activity HflC (stomatin/prohibitin superfamily)
MGNQCSESVQRGSWGRLYACSRKGTIEREGRWYCFQHDPEAVASQEAERTLARARRDEEQRAIRAEGERLAKRLGIGAQPYYRPGYPGIEGGYVEALIVSYDEIQKLLERIGWATMPNSRGG